MAGQAPNKELELELESVPASIGVARRAVAEHAGSSQHNGSHPEVDAIALATSEAVTIAVLSRFHGADRGRFTLRAAEDEADLVVRVEDPGGGTRPRLDYPGLGFSLALIAALAGDSTFSTTGPGVEVTMRFPMAR